MNMKSSHRWAQKIVLVIRSLPFLWSNFSWRFAKKLLKKSAAESLFLSWPMDNVAFGHTIQSGSYFLLEILKFMGFTSLVIVIKNKQALYMHVQTGRWPKKFTLNLEMWKQKMTPNKNNNSKSETHTLKFKILFYVCVCGFLCNKNAILVKKGNLSMDSSFVCFLDSAGTFISCSLKTSCEIELPFSL